jgi:hypothetical protein
MVINKPLRFRNIDWLPNENQCTSLPDPGRTDANTGATSSSLVFNSTSSMHYKVDEVDNNRGIVRKRCFYVVRVEML